jgi:hypothetical protein
MMFRTSSGSTYEIDEPRKRICCIRCTSLESVRTGNGVWKPYTAISTVRVGQPVVIIWPDGVPLLDATIAEGTKLPRVPGTITSLVTAVGNPGFENN